MILKGAQPPLITPKSRINVPRGTRLDDIVWLPANYEWQIWTGLENRHLPALHPDRRGTFLLLRNSGEVIRVHESGDRYEEYIVRPAQT